MEVSDDKQTVLGTATSRDGEWLLGQNPCPNPRDPQLHTALHTRSNPWRPVRCVLVGSIRHVAIAGDLQLARGVHHPSRTLPALFTLHHLPLYQSRAFRPIGTTGQTTICPKTSNRAYQHGARLTPSPAPSPPQILRQLNFAGGKGENKTSWLSRDVFCYLHSVFWNARDPSSGSPSSGWHRCGGVTSDHTHKPPTARRSVSRFQ